MSISLIRQAAMGLMQSAQYQAQVTSNNIANIRTEGYSVRKVVQTATNSQGIGTGVEVTRVYSDIDRFLERNLASNLSNYSYKKTLADNLKELTSFFGSLKNKDSTLSAKISLFEAKLILVQNKPNNAENRMLALKALENITDSLRGISEDIQRKRTAVSVELETQIGELNNNLKKIHSLNEEASKLSGSKQSSTDLEDKRRLALKKLSEKIEISYFIDAQNRAVVSTNGGSLLVGKYPKLMSYQSPAILGKNIKYPLSVPGILIDSKDITEEIDTGRLGALIRMRDKDLVQKQEELDQLAFQLKSKLNGLSTKGIRYPLSSEVLGTEKQFLTTPLSMSGQFKIALSDSEGRTQIVHSVDLAGVAAVGDLISKLNSLSDVSAGLDPIGRLKITATGGRKLALIASSDTDGGAPPRNMKQVFGVDTLLSGRGADDLKVNAILKENPDFLPRGRPNTTVGEILSSSSDVGNLSKLIEGLKSNKFLSAGKLPIKTTSFENYSTYLLSTLAEETNSLKNGSEVDLNVIKVLRRSIAAKNGVNMNEEIANLAQHQKSFELGGQIMKTAQEMFNTLMRLSR